MRQFKNYDAVKVNSEVEATEFLQHLEDNTDLKWMRGENPTEVSKAFLYNSGFPFFIEVVDGRLLWVLLENTLGFKTKIIPLSEFLEPKAINNKK